MKREIKKLNSFFIKLLKKRKVCGKIIKKEDSNYVSNFFDKQISDISKNYDHIDHMINDITKAKIDLLSNANKNLVFDKLLINLLRR